MHKMTQSEMYCTECGGHNIPIRRKLNQQREPGHLKSMYCIYCKKITNMVEIRPFGRQYDLSWFNLEFKRGNFKNGQRVIPLGDFKQMIHNERMKYNEGNN